MLSTVNKRSVNLHRAANAAAGQALAAGPGMEARGMGEARGSLSGAAEVSCVEWSGGDSTGGEGCFVLATTRHRAQAGELRRNKALAYEPLRDDTLAGTPSRHWEIQCVV